MKLKQKIRVAMREKKKRTSQMLRMFVVTLGEIEMCDARAAGCLGPGWTGFSVNCQIIVSTY